MSAKNPRLQFTDAERGAPRLKEHIRRADKAADKADSARQKIPKQKKLVEQRTVDPTTGKVKTRLYFEDVDKSAPSSKLAHAVKASPLNAVSAQAHRKIQEAEQDNVGLESTHKVEESAEGGMRLAAHSYRTQKLRPYREAAKAKMKMEKANVNALYQRHVQDNPQIASNPISRWRQKRAIKKQYAASVRAGESVTATMENAAKAAKHAAEKSERAEKFIRKHKNAIGIVFALFLIVSVFLNGMSSCSMLVEGVLSSLSSSTFPSQDVDMLGAEAVYAGMEAQMKSKLDNYESAHSYDEYHYDLDEIKHDP